jgi:hypothetical protein
MLSHFLKTIIMGNTQSSSFMISHKKNLIKLINRSKLCNEKYYLIYIPCDVDDNGRIVFDMHFYNKDIIEYYGFYNGLFISINEEKYVRKLSENIYIYSPMELLQIGKYNDEWKKLIDEWKNMKEMNDKITCEFI